MSRKQKSLSQKEQVIISLMGAGVFGLWQMHSQLKSHLDDCAKKSQVVAQIAKAILVAVVIELILRGLNMFQLSSAVKTMATTGVIGP